MMSMRPRPGPVSTAALAAVEFCLLLAILSLMLGLQTTEGTGRDGLAWMEKIPESFGFALLVSLGMLGMGLYWGRHREGPLHLGLRLILGVGVGGMGLLLASVLLPGLDPGAGEVVSGLLISALTVAAVRCVHSRILRSGSWRRRVLVLGAGRRAAELEGLRRRTDWNGLELVGYVPEERDRIAVPAAKIVPACADLRELVRRLRIDEVVVALDERRGGLPVDELMDCKFGGVAVTELADFYERRTGKVNLQAVAPSALLFSAGYRPTAYLRHGKRAFDVVVSLVMLALLWPLMLLAAVSVLIESRGRGPVLYRQTRVGLGGRTFRVVKFRTMRVDAEADGRARYADRDDPRVTRNGRVLRALRLDELPQLFNVLRGDMSLVGPRPERPEFVRELVREIPYYDLRHRVPPGLTGWAQISYPYGADSRQAREKLQYDLYYIKHCGLLMDMLILAQTLHTVLWGRGAR